MKSILLLLLTTLSAFTIQSQTIEGTYINQWVANSGEGIEYVLTLNENGEFTFNYTRMYMNSDANTTVEVNGTWNMDSNLLVLKTNNETEKENTIAAGLNLNKARYVSISPRNPKFNMVKPSLKFYVSEIFYARDMELIKTPSTISSAE